MFTAGAANGADFKSLLAASKNDPSFTDWAGLRAAWAASAAYDPYVGSLPIQAAMDAAVQRGDFALASALAERSLRLHWLDLPAQIQAALACRQLGQSSRAAVHDRAARGIAAAIRATGDGRSAQSAFRVLAAGEEYAVAQDAQNHALGASRVQIAGHWYDVLTMRHLPDRKQSDLYFRVDEAVARGAALSTGTLPVADSDAP